MRWYGGGQPKKIYSPAQGLLLLDFELTVHINYETNALVRQSKDNPYEIFSIGAHTDRPHYYIAFTDSTGVRQELEIDKALFDVLDRFKLDDLSFLNEVDNYYERSELTEASINARGKELPEILRLALER